MQPAPKRGIFFFRLLQGRSELQRPPYSLAVADPHPRIFLAANHSPLATAFFPTRRQCYSLACPFRTHFSSSSPRSSPACSTPSPAAALSFPSPPCFSPAWPPSPPTPPTPPPSSPSPSPAP